MCKLLCFRELGVGNKVVSKFVKLSLYIYTLLYTIYYLFIIIYLLPTTIYPILLYFNTLQVGSNLIFCNNQLTTLLPCYI